MPSRPVTFRRKEPVGFAFYLFQPRPWDGSLFPKSFLGFDRIETILHGFQHFDVIHRYQKRNFLAVTLDQP